MYKIDIYKIAYAVAFCALTHSSQAALLTFNSLNAAGNAAAQANWLVAIGGGGPQHLVDFESGFVDGQNVHGMGFAGGLVISDSTGSNSVLIEGTPGAIGGSNPIDRFAITHNELADLVLDFSATPVDYVGLFDIDQAGTSIRVTFVGGSTETFSIETTAVSGDSAEFVGIFRNDQPRITKVELDASGDGTWGVDNIQYGKIPEPSSSILLGLGAIGLAARRKR